MEKTKRLDSQLPNDICVLLKNCVDEMLKETEDVQLYLDLEIKTKLLEDEKKEKKEQKERFNVELAVRDKEVQEKEERLIAELAVKD